MCYKQGIVIKRYATSDEKSKFQQISGPAVPLRLYGRSIVGIIYYLREAIVSGTCKGGKKFNRQKTLFRDRPRYKSIGDARQNANNQIIIGAQVEELKNAGCVVVSQETASSVNKINKKRPQFDAALATLREGDEIVFTNSDRGFINQRHCIDTFSHLKGK